MTDKTPDGRDETLDERADRNWNEIVQELRVTQTGTQILSGFLLTVAFQQSFSGLQTYQHVIYLVLVVLAAATTTVGLIPVSMHRRAFHEHRKPQLVERADRLLKVDLVLVSVLTASVVFFLFDVVASLPIAIVAGVVVAVAMLVLLLYFPLGRGGTQGAERDVSHFDSAVVMTFTEPVHPSCGAVFARAT